MNLPWTILWTKLKYAKIGSNISIYQLVESIALIGDRKTLIEVRTHDDRTMHFPQGLCVVEMVYFTCPAICQLMIGATAVYLV